MDLLHLLYHIKDNIASYNKTYAEQILGYDHKMLEKYDKLIETDCWTTVRMLLSAFDQGTEELFIDVYHIELGGYHEFLVMYKREGSKYLIGSWAEKFIMDIKEIPDIEAFDKYLLSLQEANINDRKEMLRALFGLGAVRDTDNMNGAMEIVKIGMKSYYDDNSVLSYSTSPIMNKTTIRNISILGLSQV